MSGAYEGRQIVGMDLHQRQSVLVRMTGEQLETVLAPVQPDEVEGFGFLVDRVIDDSVNRLGRCGYRGPKQQRRQLLIDGCCSQQRRSGTGPIPAHHGRARTTGA